MERFNLNTWLEDKSRKIVTRDGKQARIICYDVKQGKDDCYVPIIALVDKGEEFGEMSYYYSEDGRFLRNPEQTHNLDLFFADGELTEFEKELEKFRAHILATSGEKYDENGECVIKNVSKTLLDLARKEIEKENPYSGNQKQEWNEKDEHCIELLLPIIDSSSLIPKNRKKCKEFLKSLKSSHWKPSEEQMNALDKAKNNPANYHDIRLGLQSLYNDLIKF